MTIHHHDTNYVTAVRLMVQDTIEAGFAGCGLTGGTECFSDGVRRCPGWPMGEYKGHDAKDCPLAAHSDGLKWMITEVTHAVAGDYGHRAILNADAISRAARRRGGATQSTA